MKIANIIKILIVFFLIAIGFRPNTTTLAVAISDCSDHYPEPSAEPTDIVYSEAELLQWLVERAYSNAGGTVILGAVITVTESISVYCTGAIVINTGAYGLVYDGGFICLSELEIIGEGVDMPVLDVCNVISCGYYWESGWNDTLRDLHITATGRNGIGGTALRIRKTDGYPVRHISYTSEGLIRSYGRGAIGLYLDEALNAYCFKIEVDGAGSAAVYAPRGAQLIYCKLTANGENAAVISGADTITLDTCTAAPEPPQSQVIKRRITNVVGNRMYYPVRQNGGLGNIENMITFLLSDGEGKNYIKDSFVVCWDEEALDVDTGIIRETICQGSLLSPFQGLGMEDEFNIELVIDVRDPDVPCIGGYSFKDDEEAGSHVYLFFWDNYDYNDESIVLWRSDDSGENWYDFTDSPELEWDRYDLCFYYGDITGTIMLKLEVAGEESNTMVIYDFDSAVYSGSGGDRDGGDQKQQDELPNTDLNSIDNKKKKIYTGETIAEQPVSDSTNDETVNPADNEQYQEPENSDRNEAAVAAVVLTGNEIKRQAEANPRYLTVIRNGIKVVIKTAAINSLALSDDDIFTVYMDSGKDSFEISFYVNGAEIDGFEGYSFTAYIPYSLDQEASFENIYCKKELGTEIFAEDYQADWIVFTLEQTGRYTIFETADDTISPVSVSEISADDLEDITNYSDLGYENNNNNNYRQLLISLVVITVITSFCLIFVYRNRKRRISNE